MKYGLNLYSVRNLIKTEEDFLSTAEKLRDMGYSYLQYSGAPLIADRIKRVSEATGLPICLTHSPMDRILGDTEALMDEHEVFGCKRIGLGMLPRSTISDPELFYPAVEALSEAAEKMAKRGFSFFYHHHHYEFLKLDGVTALDYMIKNAPKINFTLDTYWIQYGGGDVLEYIEKLKGRIACVHLKDYAIRIKEDGDFAPDFAPVGDGTMNFPTIVDKMKASGTEFFLVEQDNAPNFPDALAEVKRSIDYLKGI